MAATDPKADATFNAIRKNLDVSQPSVAPQAQPEWIEQAAFLDHQSMSQVAAAQSSQFYPSDGQRKQVADDDAWMIEWADSMKKKKILDTDDWQPVNPNAPEIVAQPLPSITTSWQNCTSLTDPATNLQTALRCHLVSSSSIPLSADVFRLGCSRPKCRISFLPDQPDESQNRFVFEYQPNYPANFTSEDVGNPDLFPDLAWITDGFSVGRVAFNIQYTQESTPAITQSLLEVADSVQYNMVQSCCSRILQPNNAVPDELVF
eukprot:TRINITY_DN6057_c0_g1_i5.p1 TRINITY_DN6057_c0_g1~~TRINITY_DN6057_c0_g1_i5.p1  ORF type:complete len:307 (-),score=69.74 TRINITY_DN6057_c0_g1_i5:48-833(-)